MSNNFYNKLNNIYNNNKLKQKVSKNYLYKNSKADMNKMMKKSGSLPTIKNKNSN